MWTWRSGYALSVKNTIIDSVTAGGKKYNTILFRFAGNYFKQILVYIITKLIITGLIDKHFPLNHKCKR